MYLTEILENTEALSVFGKIAQLFWGDVFTLKDLLDFIIVVSEVVALVWILPRWILNNIVKLFAPYRAYKEDIDAVLGKETRKRSEKYYIATRGQDVDPCNEEEIRENNGKYNTEEMIPFLCKKAFAKDSFGKHYIILADSGMGKTTFLVNLYRYYVLKKWFWSRDRKNMRYIPLSSENCMEKIQEIENPGKTILLLDALDESRAAMADCDAFMEQLMQGTEGFYRIVITCRTHFFANEKEEPKNSGLLRPGIGDKNLKFTKKYITPFSDDEVNAYLRKRFRFQFGMQKKAKEIVKKVPAIMARPLILNWIDCLVETEKKMKYTYEIYETIIDNWIKREPEIHTNGKLQELSRQIAEWMLEYSTTLIPASVVEEIATKEGIELMPIVAKSRSLLNRNSKGEYKFAHRSFLEYFLSEIVINTLINTNEKEFLHDMSGFRRFFVERFLNQLAESNMFDEMLVALAQTTNPCLWVYSDLTYRKSTNRGTEVWKDVRMCQILREKNNEETIVGNYMDFTIAYDRKRSHDIKFGEILLIKFPSERHVTGEIRKILSNTKAQENRYEHVSWAAMEWINKIVHAFDAARQIGLGFPHSLK